MFDPCEIYWPEDKFRREDWTKFYWETVEEELANAQEPRGNGVQKTVFVDANYAGDLVT